jgi:hypothetical protein
MNDETSIIRSPLRSAQQPLVVKQPMAPPSANTRALPPPPAMAASALSADAERNIVVLRDWSFAKLVSNSKHLGFRAVGTLVYHPRVNDSSFGSDWFSTEIRGIHSNGVIVSSNMSLYRLEGPAAPARHNAQPRLATIMQPFSRSTWPANAQSLFEQVSKFFRSDEYVSTPPQPSRAASTPVSAPTNQRGARKQDIVEEDEDEDEEDDEEDDEDEDDVQPPRRRKALVSSKPKPRAATNKAKAPVSKAKVQADGKFKASSVSSRSSCGSCSGPTSKPVASARAVSASTSKSKADAPPVKVVRKKKKRLSILKQPDVIIIADDTDGPVDSIAKRSVTSRGRVSRRPLEFWKNERFEYDINKEVKSFSQASLPATPVRQPSLSDQSASDAKPRTPAAARASPAVVKRQPAARAAASGKKRIVDSTSESDSSSSDDDAAPVAKQRQRVPTSAKSNSATKTNAASRSSVPIKSSKSSAPVKATSKAILHTATTKPQASLKPTASKATSSKASSAPLPKRVPSRQPVLADASTSDSDEEIIVPAKGSRRPLSASQNEAEALLSHRKGATSAPALPPSKKQPARAGPAESKAPITAAATKGAIAKSNSSNAAAKSDSDEDIFECAKSKAPSKKLESAAVKFSSGSALLASEPVASTADDDDDDCTILIRTFFCHTCAWFLTRLITGHPANLAKLVHAVQACPPTPGGFWNEVAKHVGKSAAACRNRFFSEQSTPAPSKPKRQRRRPTTEVVDMARPGTLKHREQFRANVENLNEGHEVPFLCSSVAQFQGAVALCFCKRLYRMISLRALPGAVLLTSAMHCSKTTISSSLL